MAGEPVGVPTDLGPGVGGGARGRDRPSWLWSLRRSRGADRTGCDGHVPRASDRRMGPGGATRGGSGRGNRRRVVPGGPRPEPRPNLGFAVQPVAAADREPDVHEDYVSAYDLGRFAESARFVRHYPEQNPVLRGLLPSITTPAQIIAGREDDLVPWSNNEYLADLLPNSEIHPLDAGHFAWEQAPDEYGRLIAEWVTGGFQRLDGALTA